MYIADENRYSKMKYNKCGESGLKLSAVSLGLWNNFGNTSPFDVMEEMCRTAFDEGITHFDIANNYGRPFAGSAEENFGRILKRDFAPYRDELIISTKAGYHMFDGPYGDGGSRKYLIASLDSSLKRLGLDYVDIFYHHRPDFDTPLEETMLALSQIVRSGKALYVGLSNYDGVRMYEASKILSELRCPFVINQNKYSILNRTVEHNGLLDTAGNEKKGVIIFSPLSQGILAGRYINDIPEGSRVTQKGGTLKRENLNMADVEKSRKLNEIAKKRGETLAQMSLAWVLKDERVTSVLTGASSPEQIKENVRAINSAPFSEEELKLIDEISLAE